MATHKWSDRTSYQGHRINFGTWFILLVVNQLVRLKRFGGETANMTMVQGGYNKGGVAASAGTHDGGGAFDLTPFNWKWRVWLLRLFGCAAYYRPYNWDGRGGGAHIHVGVSGDGTASKGLKQQILDFLHGLNALANRAKDPNTRPNGLLILFHMPSGNDLDVRYALKDTVLRGEPSSSGPVTGTLKKNAKFVPVGSVKNGSGNYWIANTNGDFAVATDLTTKKPILKLPTPTTPVPTPPAPPIEIPSTTLTLRVGTLNVIRWRLGSRNVRRYSSFQKGLDYARRLPGLAQIIHAMGVSVFGTEESGQYVDADNLTHELGNDHWTNVLHGDDAGDITEAVHTQDKRRVLQTGKISTGNGPQVAYHNTATWSLLQDALGSEVIFLFVVTHGEYRPAGKNSASQYDLNRHEDTLVLIAEAEKIAKTAAEKYGKANVPVVYVGDWNQDKDDHYDGPGKAMAEHGYIDTELYATSKTGPQTTLNGLSKTKTTGRRLDRIFVKKGTPVGAMITVPGYPYTDHNGVSVELTLDNN